MEGKAYNALRAKLARQNETPEQRQARLDKEKQLRELKKQHEGFEAMRQKRLAQQKQKRENETRDKREQRLNCTRDRVDRLRQQESAEQSQARNSQRTERKKTIRQKETADEREARLSKRRKNEEALSLKQADSFRQNAEKATINETLIEESYLGEMNIECKHCSSLNFSKEKTVSAEPEFTRCQKGQVKLEPLHSYPDYLKNLLTSENVESKNFLSCIRAYNSSFAFASTGANIKAPPGNGPYCFRVCGQITHRTGTIHPENDEARKFSQIYILDPDEAAVHRMMLPENKDCTESIMRQIGNIMADNPFAKSIKMLHEVEKEANADAEMRGIPPSKVMLIILNDRKSDPRRYNAPVVNEVAVVFQSKDGEPPFDRDIVMHLRPDPENPMTKFKKVSILDSNLDALKYPILFPRGQVGWKVDIPRIRKTNDDDDSSSKRVRVTMREYFSHRLSVRSEFNPILNAGKLTQQYIVDAYVRAEANDLKYVEMNQSTLRAEKYNGLMDHIHRDAEANESKPGKPVILPSSFQGSLRNMHQNFQDAMAIVTKYGKPDLFVTMTCNPKWIEIVENLEPWQKAEHRPDLVARVFNLKLKDLLHDISGKGRGLFGKVKAMVHVIEFQKRGLPHAHILIILDKDHKISTAEDIDKVVVAEIPDRETSPKLFAIVTKHMIHNPCGMQNLKAPCMKDQRECCKGFPKAFQDSTAGNMDGYPLYKRRNLNPIQVGNTYIHNGWVVPYNPYLLLTYNCHINVEVCASVKSVKYLFKYVHKGHDCANVRVTEQKENEVNETKDYVDTRYVSAPEAIWRLFRFSMHDQSHTIYRLPVHLEDEQTICFKEGSEEVAVNRANKRDTKLTAWFKLNQRDCNARQYKYWEIPKHYVWDDKNTIWNNRKIGGEKVIGRMYTVSLNDPERYYLHLLLTRECGATSFEDMRTVLKDESFTICNTVRDAAREKGLLLDDTVWESTLLEAKSFAMPSQMRQLFAYICALGSPTDPFKLWNEYKNDLMEDFCYKIHGGVGICNNCELYALSDLKDALIILGRRLSDFNLPDCPNFLPGLEIAQVDEAEEQMIATEMISSLNTEQKIAFETIVNSVNANQPTGNCFFLDGPGGSGKTYLYTTLIHYFKGINEIILASASTGIAANLLIGGRTYHSLYKLPIPINETSVSSMKLDSSDADMIRRSKVMIIDECTMASRHVLNTIDKLLQEVMNRENVPFGGKVLLLGGDFRQCLNIVPHAMQSAIVQSGLKYAKSWKHFTKLSLVNNVRSVDTVYSEWLLKLGDGTLENEYGLGDDIIEIPTEFICESSLVTAVFGENISIDMMSSVSKRAILCPKNKDVDRMNEKVIGILEGESRTYLSDDSIETEDESERLNFPIEFLNSLNPSGYSPYKLTLKVGTIIMLLRNLNTKRGLCNGTRLVVRSMRDHVLEAEVITGSATGNVVLIPRIDLCNSESELPFKLKRRQFPVKPAFAMTINKSQGQTLEKVGIFLSEPVFGHGQLYVAFSRVRRGSDVKIKMIETSQQGRLVEGCEKYFTKNIVFREVFDSRAESG